MEQARRGLDSEPVKNEDYRVAYAVAEDNLRPGHTVIADSVNPLTVTRAAWRAVATRVPAPYLEVEIVCSDEAEHRRRVETRIPDIEGFELPGWQAVSEREYDAWDPDLVIDTARLSVEQSVEAIRAALDGETSI
jgi:predicted kinase